MYVYRKISPIYSNPKLSVHGSCITKIDLFRPFLLKMKFASLEIIQHLYDLEFCDFRLHKNCIWYKDMKLWGVRSIAFASRCLFEILAPLVFIKCTENSNDSMTNVDLREFWTLDTKNYFSSYFCSQVISWALSAFAMLHPHSWMTVIQLL